MTRTTTEEVERDSIEIMKFALRGGTRRPSGRSDRLRAMALGASAAFDLTGVGLTSEKLFKAKRFGQSDAARLADDANRVWRTFGASAMHGRWALDADDAMEDTEVAGQQVTQTTPSGLSSEVEVIVLAGTRSSSSSR